jgi:uncharacterized protein (DUF2141 family)
MDISGEREMNSRLAKASLIAAFSMFCNSVLPADLTVLVKNVASATGKVRVALYNQAEKFPDKVFRAREVVAAEGTVKVVFRGLLAGNYALSAFHDQNSNGKLDINAVGMPIEPYGFSNRAQGTFGPPTFASAQFYLADQPKTEVLTLE